MKRLCDVPPSCFRPKVHSILECWLQGIWTLGEQLAQEPDRDALLHELLASEAFALRDETLWVLLFEEQGPIPVDG